ncbi:MAG: hypothetical protein COT17_05500 [Elusimicrobia bacterium CG08_land_8_20_14_0_20_51_18]|nr:MAG: hypothetical protein COT17_05500 [Elusimicrobia bacterium CG08_land_8_20_14_0_20_51_18]
MNIERKNVLILIAAVLFVFVSIPGVFFNKAVKKYLNFLGIWAEKPASVIKPVFVSNLPQMRRRGTSGGDLNQPELRFITFSVKINSAGEIVLSGDFNKWSADSVRLVKREGDKWETIIPLTPGTYRYVYYVDGKKTLDPLNPSTDVYENEKVSVLNVK